MKKSGWPKQAPVHSPENRTGQAWKERTVKKQIEAGNGKIKTIEVSDGHFKCHCNAIVRIDEHGYAACEECGEIYNSNIICSPTSNRELKRRIEKHKYDCGHKES